MSRFDLTGLFWDDYVAPKIPVIKEKKTPPDPVWLADDYLPNYAEAAAFVPDLMTDAELWEARDAKHRMVWDTEFYANYALLGFKNVETNKIIAFEKFSGQEGFYLADKLKWIAENFTLIGFNDSNFDIPMLHASLAGLPTERLMDAVNHIIYGTTGAGTRPAQFYKDFKLNSFAINNIDLIALTPLGPGLKVCAGRLHAHRMADLPFAVGRRLSDEQITILRWYWTNDLENTKLLYEANKTAIGLREIMTAEYGVDVRSKSDPQIAEQVIRKEIMRISGRKYLERAKIIPWRSFQYTPPEYIKYTSPTMLWVLDFIRRQDFVIDDNGSPQMPPELDKLDLRIAGNAYRMGIGGLHSQEKRAVHIAGDTHEIRDDDVTSYYPSLIIQQKMYPPNIGPEFLFVYTKIVDTRVAAKKAGDKDTAETLKIVANGTFGKTGEGGGYSVVYYPEMMIQVTVTGQLSLLMLIERLELAGIAVISANTDGVTSKCPIDLTETRDAIMKQWEIDTGLTLENKKYKALYSRDVNNYIAVYDKPDPKEKSAFKYAKAIGAYRKTLEAYPLKWNPTCDICPEALIEFLATGKSVEETIRACTDIRKFIEVRRVAGGGYKNGEYLGKVIRWYYSTTNEGEIINAKNGHSVPRSKGAQPCMILPSQVPEDIDYSYYIERAVGMLDDFFPKKDKKALDA